MLVAPDRGAHLMAELRHTSGTESRDVATPVASAARQSPPLVPSSTPPEPESHHASWNPVTTAPPAKGRHEANALGRHLELPLTLTFRAGMTFLAAAFVVNSILGVFGSLLWGSIHYWPAYLVFVMATIFFGRWGVLLAALTPIASSLLVVSDTPFALYIPVNVVQAYIAGCLFRRLNLSPELRAPSDKLRYLMMVISIPSIIGAFLAWSIRFAVLGIDDPLLSHVAYWTLENLTPAIVPGLWLHKVIGQSFRPFAWESRTNPLSWLQRWSRQAIPLIAGLVVVGILLVITVGDEFEWRQLDTWTSLRPDIWRGVQHLVQVHPILRFVVFVVSLLFLCALGTTVRHARQTWLLTEAVCRYLPLKHITDHILNAMPTPTEQYRATALNADVRSFSATATRLSPTDLIEWLNKYVSRMCDIARIHDGALADMGGDNLMILFGLGSVKHGAMNALICALDMIASLDVLNKDLIGAGLPSMNIGIGIHTGIAIAGEIGSTERRHYTITGPAVSISYDLQQISKKLPDDLLPIVCSRETIRDAGLLSDQSQMGVELIEFSAKLSTNPECSTLFGMRCDSQIAVREALKRIGERRRLTANEQERTT
jgi:class 3 adenylate cyclase